MNRANVEDVYKLSPIQQGILFHVLYTPDSDVYFEQMNWTFDSGLDVAAFERAWQQVVSYHPILRTAFFWEDFDEPLQVVHRRVQVPLEQHDWRAMPLAAQQEQLEAYLKADRQRKFDLSEAPLLRLALIRLDEEVYHFIWSYHHLLLDGWSVMLVRHDLLALYDAFSHGKEIALKRSRPYRDYIVWLRQQDLGQAEAFWRSALAGFSAPTSLRVDLPPGSAPSQEEDYAKQQVHLSAEVTEALHTLARQQRLTLNTLVQGAWALLASRYSGEEDVVYGATVSGRPLDLSGSESMAGVFINTLPMRVRVAPETPLLDWLQRLQKEQLELRRYEYTPLVDIQRWSEVPHGLPLFDNIVVFENFPGDFIENRQNLKFFQRTNYPLTLVVYPGSRLMLRITYETNRFDAATVARMLGHLQAALEQLAAPESRRLADLSLMSEAERRQLLVDWNATDQGVRGQESGVRSAALCVHDLFEVQVARTPDAVAIICDHRPPTTDHRPPTTDRSPLHPFTPSPLQHLTYDELNTRANQLAHHLRKLGVRPGALVGICVERSLEMMVGLLGILKAGGAYVPLDPSYPTERLAFMLEDAQVAVLLTTNDQRPTTNDQRPQSPIPHPSSPPALRLSPIPHPPVVDLNADWDAIAREAAENPAGGASSTSLAYVIYTSGSTGRPKGVMVDHGNVVNFFAAMDHVIGADSPGVWLAVTSISFDISVLELLWTLTRGFQVVVRGEQAGAGDGAPGSATSSRPIDFSLFYFASDDRVATADKYKLLIEGAKFADEHDFTAVWTPERHFDAFGGLYPSPAVTSAALSTITRHVQLRAGSVVLPLHNPIRVAEEWAMIDNLSHGRAGISFASGWHADDFVLAPEQYADRKEVMRRAIETVRGLWRGESLTLRNGAGSMVDVQILPRPIQPELPIWVTAAGSPDTFRTAGEIGANVLTHLLGQSVEDLAEKIAIYREAYRQHGHGPGVGQVTLMLHTFVGTDVDAVREKVRQPFTDYLRSSVGLMKGLARSLGRDMDSEQFGEDDLAALLSHAFDRYFETSGLFGTPAMCLQMIERLKAIGVDEVGCLIDFGVDFESVMESLRYLDLVRQQSNQRRRARVEAEPLPIQLDRHRVTHMQCTPSMAGALTLDQGALQALRPLRRLLLGGEALPAALAEQLGKVVSGEIRNMYGPTETTIWSTTAALRRGEGTITIGRPIANTAIYLLDRHLRPVPIGVPGELYIGGAGVVQGYLRRPELTAERFVPNPFAGVLGDGCWVTGAESANTQHPTPTPRLYRTGDLARYLPDGMIAFLGRLDHQVKLRGFRIELGEIETALARHPDVREAVVVAREDAPGEKRLVAYVVPKIEDRGLKIEDSGSSAPDPLSSILYPLSSELRAFLRERLPDYMVPAVFVTLDALPLTPNGKIDRKALPAPDTSRPEVEAAFVTPSTQIEEQLAAIWRQVLGIEQVGTNDDFFDLGGDSIRVLQVVAKANQVGLRFTPGQLFQHPTISGLAALVSASQAAQDEEEVVIGPLPLTPIQHWFFEQNLADPHYFNQALLLEVRQALDPAVLALALRDLEVRHDALRLRFAQDGSGWRQHGGTPRASAPLTLVDLSALPPQGQDAALASAATALQASLDLAAGPLMRVALFNLGAHTPDRLLIAIHHLAVDRRSWGVLLEDLLTVYEQTSLGTTGALPPRTATFRQWAERLQEYARSEAIRQEPTYWNDALRLPVARLPLDGPAGVESNTVESARTVRVALDVEETRALLEQAPAAYQTQTDDVLLTALVEALALWTGERTLLVDLDGNGRAALGEELDLARTVGWFDTRFPALLDLTLDEAPGAALKAVKEQLRGVPNQGIGYGVLRYLSEDREVAAQMRALPQAEVHFSYWSQAEQALGAATPFRVVRESSGPRASVRGRRRYLLEVEAHLTDGQLQVEWTYSAALHDRASVEGLAEDFVAALRSLIAHCLSPDAGGYTPSDFVEFEWDQTDLDKITSVIGKSLGALGE